MGAASVSNAPPRGLHRGSLGHLLDVDLHTFDDTCVIGYPHMMIVPPPFFFRVRHSWTSPCPAPGLVLALHIALGLVVAHVDKSLMGSMSCSYLSTFVCEHNWITILRFWIIILCF